MVWAVDASTLDVMKETLLEAEPAGWDSSQELITVRDRLTKKKDRKLIWEGREFNELADSAAKFTFQHEFSLNFLPPGFV